MEAIPGAVATTITATRTTIVTKFAIIIVIIPTQCCNSLFICLLNSLSGNEHWYKKVTSYKKTQIKY